MNRASLAAVAFLGSYGLASAGDLSKPFGVGPELLRAHGPAKVHSVTIAPPSPHPMFSKYAALVGPSGELCEVNAYLPVDSKIDTLDATATVRSELTDVLGKPIAEGARRYSRDEVETIIWNGQRPVLIVSLHRFSPNGLMLKFTYDTDACKSTKPNGFLTAK